ncbi:MAG: glycosyltransferase family 1 protein [Actinobacteria bacterium]|nr:MAG: glycosyltransferase family 1 protein [Actinomycetota bacterium]
MAQKVMMVVRPVSGGMWQHVLTLLDLLDRDYDLVVCCQDDRSQLRELEKRAVKSLVVHIPASIRPLADLTALRRLRRLLRQERPALVHSHGFHGGLLVAAARPASIGAAHVCTLHTMVVKEGDGLAKRFAYGVLQRAMLHSVDRVIAVSEAVRDALPGREWLERLTVIRNGVDSDRVGPIMTAQQARASIGLGPNANVVGCVARLSAEKGVLDFVRAAAILSEKDPGLRFVLVGDGPLREEVTRLISELGLETKMRLTGAHFPAGDYMQLFDLTVVPSLSEGQSLAAIESMLLAKPVVAANVGGLADVVESDCGRLVPPGRPDAIARTVAELMASPLTKRMGQRARESALARFSAKRMGERTRAVYDMALQGAGR